MKNGKHGVLDGASIANIACTPPSDEWYSAFYLISQQGEWSLFASSDVANQLGNVSLGDGSIMMMGLGSSEMIIENYNPDQTVDVYVWYSILC